MTDLRQWRKAENLTAEQAGALIGVGRVQWFRLEAGARRVAPGKVYQLAEITGIPKHQLRPDIFPDPAESANKND